METFYLFYLKPALEYAVEMLPSVLAAAAVFFCLRPRRRGRLAARGLRSGPWREGALLLFVAFVAGLSAITMLPDHFWHRVVLGPPPDFSSDYTVCLELRLFSDSLFGLLGNLVMFLPLGFFPALLWAKPAWWRSAAAGFGMSFSVEFVQFFIGRSSDVNDLVLNTLGALCGYWIYLLLRRLAPRVTAKFTCEKLEVPDGR